jgi:hypothetical protein
MNTCFEHKDNYFTHESCNREKTCSTIDIIAVSPFFAPTVTDCKVVNNGVHSNHSAISMTWILQTNKPAFDNALLTGRPNVRKILFDKATNVIYSDVIRGRISNDSSYDEVMTALANAAKFAASEPEKVNKCWFEYNKEVLMEAIDERNRLLHSMKQKEKRIWKCSNPIFSKYTITAKKSQL